MRNGIDQEQVVEAVYDHGGPTAISGLGLANLSLIETKLAELLVEVQSKPSEWQDRREELQFEFELVKHAISNLTNFLQDKEPLHEVRLTAKIFATYLYRAAPDVVTKWQSDYPVL